MKLLIWLLICVICFSCYAKTENTQDIEKLIVYKKISDKFYLFQQYREGSLKIYNDSGPAGNYRDEAWSVQKAIQKGEPQYLKIIEECLKHYTPSDKNLRGTYWRLLNSYKDRKVYLQQTLTVLETIKSYLQTPIQEEAKDNLLRLVALFKDGTFICFYPKELNKTPVDLNAVLKQVENDIRYINHRLISLFLEQGGCFNDPKLLCERDFIIYADVILEIHQKYSVEEHPTFTAKLTHYLANAEAAQRDYDENVYLHARKQLELHYEIFVIAESCKYKFATYVLDVDKYNKLISEVRVTPDSPALQGMADELENILRPWLNKNKAVFKEENSND